MVVQFYLVLEKVLCANQENVAYPSGMCAERVALFYASSKYPNSKILKIAVSARSDVFKINDMISLAAPVDRSSLNMRENKGLI